jgi:hypothetical protein
MNYYNAFGLVLILFAWNLSEAAGQDYIYKKDGVIVKASILTVKENLISYKLYNDTTGHIYYLSNSIVDSLIYNTGEIRKFIGNEINPENTIKKERNNFLQIDIYNLLYANYSLTYEHLLKYRSFGIELGLLVNPREPFKNYWHNTMESWIYFNYNPFFYAFRLGLNFYPVQYKRFQYSTGISCLTGQYREMKFDYYYYDSNDNETKYVFAFAAMIVNNVRVGITDRIWFFLSLKISAMPLIQFISPEIGISLLL